MDVEVSIEEWDLFCDVIDRFAGEGQWRFEKEVRKFAETAGWDWMPLEDKHRFHHWVLVIYSTCHTRVHWLHRREQIAENPAPNLIYRSYGDCPSGHTLLDGLILERNHPFWEIYFPPNSFQCGCSVYPARSESSALRLGGKPEKALPAWWREGRDVDPEYWGYKMPDLLRVMHLLTEGYFERD